MKYNNFEQNPDVTVLHVMHASGACKRGTAREGAIEGFDVKFIAAFFEAQRKQQKETLAKSKMYSQDGTKIGNEISFSFCNG
jgi:hypothetical protein